ncbi:MAG TPA: transporter substrate-binding domain-containing protein [Deltaproteobacteria bacterium]|nr:transporter substrate-binding domain-containing protein [Deltaproteobacteria bacterium]OQC28835.1 MAG: ABC transporter glutamine-binding protein GlnH precursor [Deltaproteobacteria bacterium ADurb.Bin072]HRW80303.1 transporter substrate-binding domain-containing protein [Desulfomonilia bacterium]HNQ86347.1 transporter substrate-binding domain-containing protein [Deltaproteobacteria bacterium]HNS89288.1 transporter substrate-binding domain-containing protein [Deltaproteobacteria bacterium]
MKKILAGFLVALVVMTIAGPVFAGATYDKVAKSGVVRVGMMYNSIPAAYFNDKNEWVGFDVDIAEEVVRRIGASMGKDLKAERIKVNNKTRISFLTSDQIDMSVANMTHKRERDRTIDFSITYFFDGQKVLAKKGKFKALKDFKGKKLASMQGTTSEKNAMELLKKLGDPNATKNVISFQDEPSCFLALQQDKVAGWSTDSTILLGYAAKEPGKYELVGDFFSSEPYGIGVPQNDSDWRDAINFAIQDMWADGTYKKIYDKWYGPKTPYYFPLTEEIEMWP